MQNSSHKPLPTVARFKVSAFDADKNILPRLTQAVAISSAMRRGLLAISDGATVFAGKDEHDRLLKGHQHIHICPESLGKHGHISHLTAWAPMGFDRAAQQALSQLSKIWSNRTPKFELHLVLLGMGAPGDFGGRNALAGHCLAMATSKKWQSATPFVPTRHPKTFKDGRPKLDSEGLQIGSPTHDLIRLLVELNFPRPSRVEAQETTDLAGKPTSWLDFRTQRPSGRGRRSTSRGFGFEIEFVEPVQGPICAGYASHFGLGQFKPV